MDSHARGGTGGARPPARNSSEDAFFGLQGCGAPNTGSAEQRVQGADTEPQRWRNRLAHEGDFSNIFGDTPNSGAAGWKEDHVSRPNSGLLVAIDADESFSSEHDEGFILAVVPVEPSRGTVPGDRMGISVPAVS